MEELLARSLGLRDVQVVSGGFQSRGVYRARLVGEPVVVKVVAAREIDRRMLETRVGILARLGAMNEDVCRPVPVADRLLTELSLDRSVLYAVAYQFADGEAPDDSDPQHAELMGATLARLHASLAALPPVELPTLAAFPPHAALADVASRLGVPPEELVDPAGLDIQSRRQLVHGDFSSANMRLADGRVRIFDFDDCGHGPVEFDLALSLYMVLFDAMTRTDPDLYPRFRSAFLAGYRTHSDVAFSDRTLDQLVTYRVAVLGSWLAQPETASLGVRTSSEEWRAGLHRFVQQHIASGFPGPR